ncbi:MAG: tol-pal system YbgF family protein [Sandaracinaceae bacterium]
MAFRSARTRRLALAILIAALPATAGGQTTEPTSQANLLRAAGDAERAHRPADALALYERAVELAPTSRLAGNARRRIADLRAHAEDGFAPLAALSAFRDRLPAERTPEVIAAFEEEARGFPSGRVRREARLAIGEAWLTADDPARARGAFEMLLTEPGLEPTERVLAETGIARAIAVDDGAAAGAAHLEAAGLDASSTHETLARQASRAVGRVVGWVVLALFGLGVLALGRRELASSSVVRRAFAWPRALAGLYVAGAPMLLAGRYDAEALDTFAIVGAASLGLLALASWVGEALRERDAPRGQAIALAALCVLSHGAVGYLALDRAGHVVSFA